MEINRIATQRILSPTQIDLADFVINPYRGCSFGCSYCYSRQNKTVKKRSQAWGRFLDVKVNALEILEKELKTARPRKVMLGSTSECFLPQEKEFGLTQGILKRLKDKNIPVVILTKSSAIEDYITLLNFHPENKVYFTFIFSDNKTKDLFEKNTPDLERRAKTIQRLCRAGIRVKVHIGPLIPFLEDLKELFKLIPGQIREVEIEVYNARMGNFKEIADIVRSKISPEKALDLERVYSAPKEYHDFCQSLKEEVEALNRDYGFSINFIIPEFDSWYTGKIQY